MKGMIVSMQDSIKCKKLHLFKMEFQGVFDYITSKERIGSIFGLSAPTSQITYIARKKFKKRQLFLTD